MQHQVRFYPRDPKANTSAFYVRVTFRGQNLKVYLGISIPIKFWNPQKQSCMASAGGQSFDRAMHINAHFLQIRTKISELFAGETLSGRIVSKSLLKNTLQRFLNKDDKKATDSLIGAFQDFIQKQSTKLSKSRINVYNNTQRHLHNFEENYKSKLNLHDFNKDQYNLFIDYLNAQNFATSHVRIMAKALLAFLRAVTESDGISLPLHQYKLPPNYEPEVVALTKEELSAIALLDLTSFPHLEHIRDLFLVQCYSGLRFSDMQLLIPANIDLAKGELRLIVEKTKQPIAIPIIPQLAEIFKRYNSKLPSTTNQEMNRHLKTIAMLAGVDSTIPRVVSRGGKQTKEIVKKWQLVTTHTGRKTFTTISLLQGVMPDVLRKMTGHVDGKSFQRYIDIAEQIKREQLLKAWE